MTTVEQRRATVLTKVMAGEGEVGEIAELLRPGWSMAMAASHRRADSTRPPASSPGPRPWSIRRRQRQHLAELLAEPEGTVVGVERPPDPADRRDRQSASPPCTPPPQPARPDPQRRMLLQTDGSRHGWLADRGPRLTFVAAIDDVTGIITGAMFREQKDAAGYLIVLRQTIRGHGVPLAQYRGHHGIFETSPGNGPDARGSARRLAEPDPVCRALAELDILSIAVRSPAGEGSHRARLGTFQDRLVVELPLAAASDVGVAEWVLARLIVRPRLVGLRHARGAGPCTCMIYALSRGRR